MTRARRVIAAGPPWGAPLPVLQLYVEWRRLGVPVKRLARAAGYDPETVRNVLLGRHLRPFTVECLREALEAQKKNPAEAGPSDQGEETV